MNSKTWQKFIIVAVSSIKIKVGLERKMRTYNVKQTYNILLKYKVNTVSMP